MKEVKKIIAVLCKNIDNYQERVQLALSKIDRERIPLKQADRELYNEIEQEILNYLDEQEISYDYNECFEDVIDDILYTTNN